MKTIFKIIVFISFLACAINLKAQEDKISGIYVDGVKVTEIDCYSFEEMEVIFPIDKLKGFDLIQIGFKPVVENANIEEDGLAAYQFCELSYSALALKSFSSNGLTYARVKIYEKGLEGSKLGAIPDDRKYSTSRSQFFVRKDAVKKRTLEVTINCKTVNGMNENYDQSCNCIKKTPTYSTSEYMVLKMEMKPNTNGNEEPVKKKPKFKLAVLSNSSDEKYTREKFVINYNLQCPIKGQKLEDLLKTK